MSNIHLFTLKSEQIVAVKVRLTLNLTAELLTTNTFQTKTRSAKETVQGPAATH